MFPSRAPLGAIEVAGRNRQRKGFIRHSALFGNLDSIITLPDTELHSLETHLKSKINIANDPFNMTNRLQLEICLKSSHDLQPSINAGNAEYNDN